MCADILVVGAGIFGASAALELVQRGYSVEIIEAGEVPHPQAASTDISKVVRMEYGQDAEYMALAEEARLQWLALNALFGETLYHDDGVVMLSGSPMQAGGFEYESYQMLLARGHQPERLDEQAIRERFPQFGHGALVDGFFHSQGGWVESGLAVSTIIGYLREKGVLVHENTQMTLLEMVGDRVVGIKTADGQVYRAEHVVIATGAWTAHFMPELTFLMKATPQMVFHLKPANPDFFRDPTFKVFTANITATGWYGFPYHPKAEVVKLGHHATGDSVNPVTDPRIVTPMQEAQLRDFLHTYLPALATAPIAYRRICLYCDTFDEHFWITRHPTYQGLTFAAGGSGHGFKFGSVLGRLIADAIEGKTNAYTHKFGWRTPESSGHRGEASRHREGNSYV